MGSKNQVDGGAVIYLRVSTDEQVKGASLEAQEAACRQWCTREGLSVDRVFIERGASAKSDEREQFQAMIAHCRLAGGRITHVVVYRVDRFSRVAHHVGIYRALLTAVGCRLVSATENLADDPAGKLLGTILAGFAEYDNDQKAERVKASMRHLVRAGYWVHRPPFGYAIERVENRPQLVPHPESGAIMRQAFEQIAAGLWSPHEAWLAITEAGHRLSESRFYEVLRDPIYAGMIDNTLTDGAVEARGRALVSIDTFTAVQGKLATRSRVTRRLEEFPLRGVLLCPECGRRMTASASTGRAGQSYAYYHCASGEHRIAVRKMHDAIPALIDQLGKRLAPMVALIRDFVQMAITDDIGDVSARAEAARKKAHELERKRSRLLDAYLAGTIDRELFAAKDVELQDQIAFQQARVAEADYDVHEATRILEGSQRILADLPAIWARMDGEQRHELMHAMFANGLCWTGSVSDDMKQSPMANKIASCFEAAPVGDANRNKSNQIDLAGLLSALRPLLELAA